MPAARILDVDPDAYHKLPGFSASLAKILIARSAAHAKDARDRQIEDEADEDVDDDKRKRLERGSVLHHMVLGKGKRIAVVPFADYRSKDAKAARDAARASGMIPVKEAEYEILSGVARAIGARIAAAGHVLDGASEVAIEWWEQTQHGEAQCRAMLDHFITWGLDPRDETGPVGAIVYDLKIVDDAAHERCERTAENLGYAIQAAAYRRALTALHPRLGGRIEFRFLFCESRRPYELWDPEPDGMFEALGEQRWLRAVRAWGAGLATGQWPGLRIPERKEITAPLWALRREGFTADE